jgi:hypothetical protein
MRDQTRFFYTSERTYRSVEYGNKSIPAIKLITKSTLVLKELLFAEIAVVIFGLNV